MNSTIWDVARAAGVSPTTVSRALNNAGRIGAKTRARVLKAAAELNYRPRTGTRTQAAKRSGTVLVVCDETHLPSLLADPFYGAVVAGIERRTQARGLHLLVKSLKAADTPVLEQLARESRVTGLLLVGADLSVAFVHTARQRELPIVMVDDHSPALRTDAVVTDNVSGTLAAVRYLIAKGHRRIGFVGGPLRHSSLAERFQGYRAALEEAGIPLDPAWVATEEQICGPEEGCALASRLLRDRGSSTAGSGQAVTAIVAANDMIAIGVLKAARAQGLAVPAELAVVGFDDIEFAAHTDPPLTTVHVYKEEMGRVAVDRLLERMEQPQRPPVRISLLTELVVRASG